MPYAKFTEVPVERSRNEIEATLKRFGADRFAYFTEAGKASIIFEANKRRLRFDLPLPPEKEAQKNRAAWRALLLCVKAKLQSVESGIETFEEAFLAHVVLPNGETVYQATQARITQAYDTNGMVPLLPSPKKGED